MVGGVNFGIVMQDLVVVGLPLLWSLHSDLLPQSGKGVAVGVGRDALFGLF